MTNFTKPKMTVISQAPQVKRTMRRPQHTFHLRHRPFQIQPFMIAPVLPGETMKNLLMQTRVVTDPIRNPLIGWWMEYYFFYVRLRDLEERDTLENMILDLDANTTGIDDAVAKTTHYHNAGKNYVNMCLKRVTDEYFRDEGEAVTIATLNDLPLAQFSGNSWLDSFTPDDEVETLALDADTADVPWNEFEAEYNTWMVLRQQRLTEMDFEDYLASHGVRRTLAEKNKPELIRFVREWSYPSNTVNPAAVLDGEGEVVTPAGAPTSAVSWSIAERADKDRFFAEPGFIFGVTVARPKIYLSGQREAAVHLLDNTMMWLPAMLRDNPETSLRKIAQATGPLGGNITTDDYWVDMRDLFMYGDQYLNFALTATDANFLDLPLETGAALSRYPVEADIDDLFVDTTANSDSSKNKIRQDGVVNLSVLGTQVDHT